MADTPNFKNRAMHSRYLFVLLFATLTTAAVMAQKLPHVGRWKLNPVKSHFGPQNTEATSAKVLDIAAAGTDGLVWKLDDLLTCEARFDGKDHPCKGPIAVGWTVMVAKKEHSVLEVTAKSDGEMVARFLLTVSADGKTLTEQQLMGDKVTRVYDRQ